MPYWRLSSFYFWYFALLGALYPFWSLYFQASGFNAEQIGLLMAALMGSKIVAPNIWAWLAKRRGNQLQVMRLGSLLSLICFGAMLWQLPFAWTLAAMISYSFFWNAVLPQYEAITLSFLHRDPNRYSRIRLWGSIGFIAAVVAIGAWFESHSVQALPLIGCGLLALIWLSSLAIPDRTLTARPRSRGGFWPRLRQPAVIAFLASGLLMQIAHGIYYSFFSIHLEGLGYCSADIGLLWALGVVAEVVVFLVMHRWLPRFGVKLLMIASLLLAALRWWLIGSFADHLWLLLAAQLMHAFTFGVFHSAGIEVMRRFFGRDHQGQGQALYGALSFGVGGAIGSIAAGELWGQGATLVFGLATLVSILGALIVAIWQPSERQRRSNPAIADQ